MPTSSVFLILAVVAAAQTASPANDGAYRHVLDAQYRARTPAVAQQPEEARRLYESYLNAVAEKAKSNADHPVGAFENQPH